MAQERHGLSARATGLSVLIALGANAPFRGEPPDTTLRHALAALAEAGAAPQAVSRFYRTPAFPPGAGPDFVNAAASLAWAGGPAEILALLHRVERRFGRERPVRWGPRTLDLDLLACGDAVLPDRATFEAWAALPPDRQRREAPEELILPHPRLHERPFVLIPLADIAPDWRHPVFGRSVSEMVASLPAQTRSDVTPL